MLIGYNILNKKEKSGMKSMKLRVSSLKTKYKLVLKSFFGQFYDFLWIGIKGVVVLGQLS